MPRKLADLNGTRYGMLTVEELTDQRNGYGRLLYRCRCDCGGERMATRANLERGEITSCGCLSHRVRKDLTGQRFGRLLVVSVASPPVDRKNTTYTWRCMCDCGKTVEVSTNSLTKGTTRSCGCLQREAVKALYIDNTAPCKLSESKHPRSTNTSGITGVWWNRARGKWQAEIMFRGKKHYLGRFSSREEAAAARAEAEERLFGPYIKNI